jgi:TP901 family phage tail tape measure protein
MVPFAAAVRSGAEYETTLLSIQASAGATQQQLQALRAASMEMSAAMGVGPQQVASSFLELLKAGMSVEQVLGGAGQAAIEFAAVGQMDVAAAAVVMADAMNVFGVDAAKAANSISAAADASSTSIELMSQSFAQVSAVAALANQSIDDTSAALAILANNGVKGSDAGTSLKTMLMRLMSPADDAVGALKQVGLSVSSFRNADGSMQPLVEIVRTLNAALGNMDQAAKDDIFRRIFGSDAIRAAAILTSTGTEGFASMATAMADAMPVGDKFRVLMSGLAGSGANVVAAMQRAAISVSDAIAPALNELGKTIVGVIDGLTKFAANNSVVVSTIAKTAAVAAVAGGAMTALGMSIQVASFGMAGIGKVAIVAIAPLRLMALTATGIGGAFSSAIPGVLGMASATGTSMIQAGSSVATFAAQSASGVAGFATLAASQLAGFAASGIRSVGDFGSAVSGVFASQFRIARFVGQSFSAAFVTAFSKAAMSIGVVSQAVAGVGPAIAFAARGFSALASDVAGLTGSITRPFTAAASAVGSFAVSSATSIAAYVSSLAAAVAATVTHNAQIASSWVGNALTAVRAFASGAVASVGRYVGSLAAAVSATVVSAAGIAGAWVASALPATSAFVASAVSGLATYVASTALAATASVSNAVRSGVAWVSAGLPGLAAFVAGAVAGIATYLGAAAAAVAGSVAAAAAVAAAWLAPLAPFALIAAAVAAAGVAVYQFRSQISGAFSGVSGAVGQAADAVGSAFGPAVENAAVVLGDLYTSARTTFSGIYAAVAEGDLAGAMDVLWLGLQAGWLRGVEALMGYVDPWISTFQNTFTVLGADIYKTWDGLWTSVTSSFSSVSAVLLGAFDNVINPILAAWDVLEAGIRKSWNRVQSFFKRGFDLKAENNKVDSEMGARKRQRELERPGMEGRSKEATDKNRKAEAERKQRADAVDAGTQATIDQRDTANRSRAAARRQDTVNAQDTLTGAVRGKREAKVQGEQFARLFEDIKKATTLDQLRNAYGEFDALSGNGRLTSVQMATIETALEDAQERITKAGMSGSAAGSSASANIQAGAGAAGEQASKRSGDVAGTFSSFVGGMGVGSTLAEKQVTLLQTIADNTSNLEAPATVGD